MPVLVKYGAQASSIDPDKGVVNLSVPFLAGNGIEQLSSKNSLLKPTAQAQLQAVDGHSRWIVLSSPLGEKLESLAETTYTKLFAQLKGGSCLRIWNFVPEINATQDGLENYQAFCIGRHRAYQKHFGDAVRQAYCAASAVGCDDDQLTVIALITEEPVTHLENPLQCPAYEYPPIYGPRPPSFSRASIVSGEHPALYVSGTSAVTGSDSIAPDDLAGQLNVTANNLERILTIGTEQLGRSLDELNPPYCRLYIRHAENIAEAEAWLLNLPWVKEDRTMIVRADICRAELVAELELSYPLTLVKHPEGCVSHAK